jgi:hypothetical protein
VNKTSLEEIVQAVLYEGYILYPYRATSPKNQRERFTFGRVYPADYSIAQNGAEPCMMQAQVLVKNVSDQVPGVKISVRFLHAIRRLIGALPDPLTEWPRDGEPIYKLVPKLEIGDEVFQTWHEAVEREISLPPLNLDSKSSTRVPFQFPPTRSVEPITAKDGTIPGAIVRQQRAINGTIEVESERLGACAKVTVRVLNGTSLEAAGLVDANAVIETTMASTHIILTAENGEFISLLEPGAELNSVATECRNIGVWPILVGDESSNRDTMLASPIILYDWPKIAKESAGPLFDGTEIDEILNLRILTMTDDEKREMRNIDAAARKVLERAENLCGEDFLKMHGTLRDLRPLEEQIFGTGHRLDVINIGDVDLKPGDRVRIRPKSRADIMDIALDGRVAIIEALEEDAEARVHLALVVQDDPGKDLGMLRQPGHRFFYTIDEVEPVKEVT